MPEGIAFVAPDCRFFSSQFFFLALRAKALEREELVFEFEREELVFEFEQARFLGLQGKA